MNAVYAKRSYYKRKLKVMEMEQNIKDLRLERLLYKAELAVVAEREHSPGGGGAHV